MGYTGYVREVQVCFDVSGWARLTLSVPGDVIEDSIRAGLESGEFLVVGDGDGDVLCATLARVGSLVGRDGDLEFSNFAVSPVFDEIDDLPF